MILSQTFLLRQILPQAQDNVDCGQFGDSKGNWGSYIHPRNTCLSGLACSILWQEHQDESDIDLVLKEISIQG
jgi:hypothetical protein